MGIIEQYLVSQASPNVVGGTGTAIKYFASNPPANLWNVGAVGVNAPFVGQIQLGAVPSSTNASGQLPFDSVASKLVGGRFRVYMSGSASSDGTPTLTPVVQLNSGTIASPSYATLLGGVASAAVTANKAVAFSIAGDLFFDPTAGTLSGFFKYTYAAAAGGTPLQTAVAEATITNPTGLTAGGLYAAQFGLVCGITFSVSSAANTASLYEFKIVQD